MNELDAALVLNAISGIGPKRFEKLYERFGSAQEILSLKEEQLKETELPLDVVQALLVFDREAFLKKEYELIKRNNVEVITFNEEGYPALLKQISDAPVVLYIKGHLDLANKPSLSIVGSRRASLYGVSIAENFSARLTELGFSVVSGMARGIDTAAHRGALKAQGNTIAILGCGLNHVYPPENKHLMEEISLSGAVISEFPLETPPLAFHFPRRNRIISGLSLGVMVVEASLNSGALITADCALEQNREVFAVPGPIGEPNSQGTHHLIKQGAKLVQSIDDILEELKFPLSSLGNEKGGEPQRPARPSSDNSLSDAERNICKFISQSPVHIDELVYQTGASTTQLAPILFDLELKKAVKQLPGKMFVRCY